ncbi:protein of unknown function [Bradyrhizobium sp. ORS 285]|nr:protein of unknown function [Bradyrhizobium sp. ORS 285]
MPVAPMARLQQKSRRQSPQVRAGSSGLPRAMALRLIRALPGDRLLTPSPCALVQTLRRRLGLGTGRPGPHDFAVRIGSFVGMIAHAATRHAHRIPHSTLVTIAKRPSSETGCDTIALSSEKRKKKDSDFRVGGAELRDRDAVAESSKH